jgi:queuine tRNA-ribosyltransferase
VTHPIFRIIASDGAARAGLLEVAHGLVPTPVFMPVGTAATVKALTPDMVAVTGARMLLANTYHLMLRPGAERIARLGGLHAFMSWPGPILTDSGGYQVMSLSELRAIDEDGVDFRSHVDGSRHRLTPEQAIEIQRLLDSDIAMVLDECPSFGIDADAAASSMRRSTRWASRCREAFVARPGYALFGIVQGGVHPELREESATALTGIGFDGYAIGGLAVGEGRETMFRMLDVTAPLLPAERPRYLMGVGKPEDLVGAVARGVDLFDCVLPTRSGRTGQAFTRFGPVNLRNARHAEDPRPLDESVPCPASREYSRAYLRHLVRSGEILGAMLLSWHNIAYYQHLMAGMREAIVAGAFAAFAEGFALEYARGDIEPWSASAAGGCYALSPRRSAAKREAAGASG